MCSPSLWMAPRSQSGPQTTCLSGRMLWKSTDLEKSSTRLTFRDGTGDGTYPFSVRMGPFKWCQHYIIYPFKLIYLFLWNGFLLCIWGIKHKKVYTCSVHDLNMHSRMKCHPFRSATEEYTIILWREIERPSLSLWHNLSDKRIWKRQHAGGGGVSLHEVSVPCWSVFWSSNTSAPPQGLSARRQV